MMSLLEREILAASDDLVPDTANWVTMWIDEGHRVSMDRGTTTAFRGIDSDGQLMWMVRHARKSHGYHSLLTDPLAAIEQAEEAWEGRRTVRKRWDQVERVASDLIRGQLKFSVSRDDAARSPLWTVGIDSFMRRMGLGNVQSMSGRAAALLMRVEPQVGFVIDAAHARAMQTAPERAKGGKLMQRAT